MLYLDESGNHDLRPDKINSRYPVFVLGGVVVDRLYERTVIAPQMRDFKMHYLGTDQIVLHTVDMHRVRNGFEPLADREFRLDFYRALNELINSWDFKIIACVIKLHDHIIQYKDHALDPYMHSLDVVVERFCRELDGTADNGFICAEMRNPGLDRDLRKAWGKIRQEGTEFASAAEIDEKIVHLTLKDKKPNIAGMQLADLIVTPIGRDVLNLSTKDDEVSRRIVKTKVRHGAAGQHRGYGLVVLPDFQAKK
jgi:hypothetical protein